MGRKNMTVNGFIKNQKCERCKNPFKANTFIKGDNVCDSCNRLNDITYWYPKLFRLNFPTPKTIILHTNLPLEQLADGVIPKGTDKFILDLKLSSVEVGTYPVFLRTGYLSNKHDWKNSCFLDKETLKDNKKMLRHITNLVEMSAIATIDRFMPCDFWAVREFIKTKSYFTYFAGEMPITKEVRFFVQNGKIKCRHPYWPKDVFENIEIEKIKELNSLTEDDEKVLNGMALYVSEIFSGNWSCDFLKGENNQWYLTDMAIGERSYHQEHKV